MNIFMRKPFFMHPEAGSAGATAPPAEQTPGAQPAEGEARPDKTPNSETPPAVQGDAVSFTPEQEAQIERLLDRRTHQLGHQIKTLETQLADRQEKLAKHVSADELRQMELDEKEAQLAAQEAELALERRQRCATEAIMAAGLGQDSKKALQLRDFVMAEDEAGTQKRVSVFKALVQDYVAQDVQQIFKSGGKTPEAGGQGVNGADYDQKISQAMGQGNLGEAAYWTRKKAEETKGG